VERGTPPPAGAVASLDSSSSSLLDIVVVVLLLDLVHVRLLLHAWGPARGMAREGGLVVVVVLLDLAGAACVAREVERRS